jgi:branched-chain amino acid transport system substrate-binding protein
MPRLGALITHGLGARKIGLIWVDNEFGHDGRAVLLPVLKRNSATVTFDGPVKSGQKDFAQTVAALKATGVDALLLYVNEGEAVGVLKQLKAQGFDKPIVSDGLVAAQKVIDSAGPAADGVLVHMNMSTGVANPSVQAFVSRYVARYGARPDQNSMKGFIAVQTIKAGVEMAGKADPALFLKTIKDKRLEKKSYPELMSSVSYDYFGDLNRESYFAVIQGGSSHIVATLQSSDGGSVTLASGKQIALNSNEFRSEIKASAQPGADKAASQR